MSFSDRREVLVNTTFKAFGEFGSWPGVAGQVRVRVRNSAEEQRFGGATFRSQSTILQVRSWEVASPAEDDLVQVLTGRLAGTYRIIGEPDLDAKGVWSCGAARQP